METGTKKKVIHKIMTENETIENSHSKQYSQGLFHKDLIRPSLPNQETFKTDEIKMVINQSQDLFLKIIMKEGPKTLRITPLGLVGGRRNAEDGITYFGSEEEDENPPTVDYIIPKKHPDSGQDDCKGQIFRIKFNPLTLKYYVKDLGIGGGTFAKLQSRGEIKGYTLINVGNICIILSLGIEEEVELAENFASSPVNDDKNVINIKVFYNNVNHAFFSYTPIKNPITIGRENCDICLEDCMLSKAHCTLEFKDKWYIIDGCYNDRGELRKSTNGVWIYIPEDLEIKEGMIFKACDYLFISSFTDE